LRYLTPPPHRRLPPLISRTSLVTSSRTFRSYLSISFSRKTLFH
jgi:hypothetical protein